MQNFLLQLPLAGLAQQAPTIPELPPGPSLERVRGPVEVPFLETWQIALIAILGISVIALIGWWGFRYLRARKSRVVPVLPPDAATAELKLAVELTAGDDNRFAALSSQALRRYFEAAKNIDTLGKTTDEFLRTLKTSDLLNSDAHSVLAGFLNHCDRVKFAGESLSETDRQTLIKKAFELIETCEQTSNTAVADNLHS